MDYALHILILVETYAILAMALNLVVGFLGVLSVAHGALFGIAAYTLGIMTVKLALPFWLSFLLALILSGAVGFLIALPTFRLKDDYLALATFAFAIAAYDIFNNLTSLTEGPMGIAAIPRPSFFRYELNSKLSFLVLLTFFLIASYIVLNRIVNSPWGRILRGIRDQELAVLVSGKDVRRYKLVAFIVSSTVAGLAGVFYASYLSYIHPSSFSPMVSILILCMIVLGGLGSFKGSLLGAGILIILPEVLRFLNLPSALTGSVHQFIYGSLMVIVMLFRPKGLLGQYQFRGQ